MIVLRYRFEPRIAQYAFTLSGLGDVEARGLLWAHALAKLRLLGVRQPSRVLRKAMQKGTIMLKTFPPALVVDEASLSNRLLYAVGDPLTVESPQPTFRRS